MDGLTLELLKNAFDDKEWMSLDEIAEKCNVKVSNVIAYIQDNPYAFEASVEMKKPLFSMPPDKNIIFSQSHSDRIDRILVLYNQYSIS